jgi:hypothetical protein
MFMHAISRGLSVAVDASQLAAHLLVIASVTWGQNGTAQNQTHPWSRIDAEP